MARGGGTGSRNKKKKAGPDTAAAPQNGVMENNIKNSGDHAADKHKNTKHTRKQKEDTPPVVPHQEEDSQLKEGKQKREPTSEELRLAQITQGADSNKDPQRKATINQIMEITGKSEDDVATALFDTDWDENRAIDLLLDESAGFGSWEETGKKKTKKAEKEEGRENEDLNDDFDPTNSDNRERSRNRGGPQRLRNGRGGSNHAGGRGDSDWKHRENQENERNFEGGRGRGGRGMGPRGRGGHVGMAPRGERRGGRGGGPRGGGHRPDQERGGEGLGQIDTWNPIGSEQQEQQRRRNNKDAFDNAGNWGDDFPAAEDWDNDEYTGSLADSKVFTPSGTSAKAVGEPVNGSAAGHVGQPGSGQAPGGGQAPAANNSLSYSQPIDLSSLLKTGGLSQYNAAASQDLKSAIGIGGGKAPGAPPGESLTGAGYTGGSLSYSSGSSPYTSQGHQSSSFSSAAPGSAFSPIKPAAVTNGAGGGKSMPRARLPPPSRIPSSAVEMPGAGEGSLSSLDVQFGGMDLQFGGSANDSGSNLDFNAAPGQGMASSTTPSKDSSYVHSIQSSGGKDDSYKASPSLAPGSVKDVNQSLSSALSAGIKPPVAGSNDSVPGYGRGGDSDSRSSGPGSRSGEKYGSAPQRSPGPALISKPDLGYNSQSSYPYQSSGGPSSGGKSSYNSYSGASQSYERQSSSGYSGTNGLNSSYGGGSGSSSSYNNASQAGSGYPSSNSGFNSSQQGNNFGSGYGAATTAGAYSSFSSQNSYSGKTGGSSNQTSNSSYLPTTSALSSYSNSGPDSSSLTSTAATSKTSEYATATVSASSSSLGLSSSASSSKMSVNTTQGNKLVPGMPPGVAGVLPAQYMTPAGFPAAYLAGLGQPTAAMYGYGGHQLEDLAALQRSTLAASLPQLVGSAGAAGQPGPAGSQPVQAKGFGAAGAGAGGVGGAPSTLSGRQDAGQNSFSDSKFSASADSTSSPVPSTVGNTVGQQPAFNLASTFTAAAAQHPTLPPGYAYFYGGVGGMPGLQYGGGVAGGGVYPGQHPGIPVPTAAGPTSTSQFQNKAAYGNSYGTSYDSLGQSLGQSSSGYVKNNYANDSSQGKAGGSSNNTAAGRTGYWSNLW